MIAFEYEYYRPETMEEALYAFKDATQKGKAPIYYGGGTEIITFAKKGILRTGAVIDIKHIKECIDIESKDDHIILGSALTLNELAELDEFKLLKRVAGTIADHTVRNRITLGGNICGRLPYREMVMPLLLADAKAVIAAPEGIKIVSFTEAFDKRLLMKPEEFLLRIIIDKEALELPFYHVRKEKQGKVDYPLCHLVALKNNKIRFAFSGVGHFPFRSFALEEILNNTSIEPKARLELAMDQFPTDIRKDLLGSARYRRYLLKNALTETLAYLEGVGR